MQRTTLYNGPAGHAWYNIDITLPGPRGGKGVRLVSIRTRAYDYNDAVERAWDQLNADSKVEVSAR